MTHTRFAKRNQGVALVTALGLLLLFAMLGTAYVRYMSIEMDDARYGLLNVRAEQLSEAAIMAAIGEIETALNNNQIPASEYDLTLPLYYHKQDGAQPIDQTITVLVKDESSRININHATPKMLTALGIKPEVAQQISQSLPNQNSGADAKWFNSVDELRTRGFLNGPEYNALTHDLLTVYSTDHDSPENYINLNTATATVLGWLFNVEAEEAKIVASKRPFTSWEDVLTKVGREPSTFNVGDIPYGSREKPKGLAFQSRCFRLVSDGLIKDVPGTTSNGLHCGTEAILLIDEKNNGSLRFWNVRPLYADEETEPSDESKPDTNTTETKE